MYFSLRTPSVARSVVKSSLHGPPFAVYCQYLGVPMVERSNLHLSLLFKKCPTVWETQYQEAEEVSSYTGWKGAAELLLKTGSIPEDEN